MTARFIRVLAAGSLAAVAVVTAHAGAAGKGGDTTSSFGQFGHAGRWITDADGRVFITHGVNMPSKTTPATPQSLNFGDDDAALLNRLGMNTVRLTLERYAAEPTPGQFNYAYIDQFAQTMQMLASHGIYTLIDFHQDDYGITFFDNGYPDWMTVTDGLPNLFFSPFPTQYFDNPAQNRAWDHLWANDPDATTAAKPLQEDDATLLTTVAGQLKSQPGLLGYEILNEPWPGTLYQQCLLPQTGCPDFDKGVFSSYYQRIATAIRGADPQHFVWYEPLTTFNQGVPTSVIPPSISNRGFAFHDYNLCGDSSQLRLPVDTDTVCPSKSTDVLANAIAFSKSTGDPLLETEFGATMDTPTISKALDAYDQTMMPWLWWSYTRYVVALDSNNALTPATDNDVNWPLADTLARPYPQLISGTPLGWHWDATAKVFTFRYSTARAGGTGHFVPGSTTTVNVPLRNFPAGFGIDVAGGYVTSVPGSQLVTIASCPGAATVSVTVSATATTTTSCAKSH